MNFRATALEIAAALAYLHGLDLLHGDLTGGNILLSSSHVNERGFCAKVADFGLSRTVGSEPIDVNTYGTVTHMPPELLTTGELTQLTCDVISCHDILQGQLWALVWQTVLVRYSPKMIPGNSFIESVPQPCKLICCNILLVHVLLKECLTPQAAHLRHQICTGCQAMQIVLEDTICQSSCSPSVSLQSSVA